METIRIRERAQRGMLAGHRLVACVAVLALLGCGSNGSSESSTTTTPPQANAGGPYAGHTDAPIALDGTGSMAVDGTLVEHAWDFDGDGVFDDALGPMVSFQTAEAGTHDVWLRVTDSEGATSTDMASVEVTELNLASEGYNLYTQRRGGEAYLMDNDGNFVHTWMLPNDQGNTVYLLENGELLVAGSEFVLTLDWDSNVTWFFDGSATGYVLHHDVEWLPSGNVLMIARQTLTAEEAHAAGRNPALLLDGELWSDCIIEVDPSTN